MANLANFFSFSFLLLVLLSMDSFFLIFFILFFYHYTFACNRMLSLYYLYILVSFISIFFPFSHFFDIFWIRHGLLQQSIIELFGLN